MGKIVDLESKNAKWDSKMGSLQLSEEWMERKRN